MWLQLRRICLAAPLAAGVAAAAEPPPEVATGAVVVSADAHGPVRPLRTGWRTIAGGSAANAARAAWQDAAKQAVAECGFTAVVLDGLADPALHLPRGAAGTGNTVFLDNLIDRLLALSLRPDLVLVADREFDRRLGEHLVDRYSVTELRLWHLTGTTAEQAAFRAGAGDTGPAPGLPAITPRPAAAEPNFGADELPAAAYLLRHWLEQAPPPPYPQICDGPDDAGAGLPGPFHGGAGIVNACGMVKPSFHAFRFLNALGEDVLASSPGWVVTRRRGSGRLVLLAYNFPVGAPAQLPRAATLAAAEAFASFGAARMVAVSLSGMQPGAQILVEKIDAGHGNAVASWNQLRRPASPGRAALETLRTDAHAGAVEYRQVDDQGRFVDTLPLEPWGMLLLREL